MKFALERHNFPQKHSNFFPPKNILLGQIVLNPLQSWRQPQFKLFSFMANLNFHLWHVTRSHCFMDYSIMFMACIIVLHDKLH
jgi:hypothetical protein